jgi:hypothetical protein
MSELFRVVTEFRRPDGTVEVVAGRPLPKAVAQLWVDAGPDEGRLGPGETCVMRIVPESEWIRAQSQWQGGRS